MSIKYEWTWYVHEGEQTNDLEECRACAAVVPLYNFPTRNLGLSNKPDVDPCYLCALCASTPAGTAHEYPRQWETQHRDIMACTNYSANMILLQMGKWGAPGQVPTLNPKGTYS